MSSQISWSPSRVQLRVDDYLKLVKEFTHVTVRRQKLLVTLRKI